MLKGNLIVGKNQSVVLHAQSLEDLLRLAESTCESSRQASPHSEIKLRVDIRPDAAEMSALADASLVVTSSKNPRHP